tara:strand:+ start:1506 stop:2465 length:960 start_codon:yes stop_codon:yes gene_type:complete
MAAMVQTYTLDDFQNIMDDGLNVTLDPGTIEIIQQLAEQVGAPEYVRTPQFVRKDRSDGSSRQRNRKNKKKAVELSDADWEAIRQFEATQREKKEGIDASMDLIRKTINKITDKTYMALIGGLHEEFEKVSDASEEDLTKLSATVFSLVSETGFYSDMLASLYVELVNKYSYLKSDLDKCLETFQAWCFKINYVSPDEDYDKYCDNNKENTRRKSVAKFLVNLARAGMIEQPQIMAFLQNIHSRLLESVDLSDSKETLDELSELVAIFTIEGKDFLSELSEWDDIQTSIASVSKMKSKNHNGLSNKTVFKYMDIMDVIG